MKIHRIKKTVGVLDLMLQLREVWEDLYNNECTLEFESLADKDFATIYFNGRSDERQKMDIDNQEPAKPLFLWKIQSKEVLFECDLAGNIQTSESITPYVLFIFEIFHGDHGGYFARCIQNHRMCTETDDLDELKDNIIDLVRNWDNDND